MAKVRVRLRNMLSRPLHINLSSTEVLSVGARGAAEVDLAQMDTEHMASLLKKGYLREVRRRTLPEPTPAPKPAPSLPPRKVKKKSKFSEPPTTSKDSSADKSDKGPASPGPEKE